MAGLNIAQLKYLVVKPSLILLDLFSDSALNLVTGTALAETGAAFLKQENNGPALGLWQIEPATEQDVWTNFLDYRPALSMQVKKLLAAGPTTSQLVWNLAYGAAICRVKYLRSPIALPDASDANGMSWLHKQAYNSMVGAANPAANIPLFQQAINA